MTFCSQPDTVYRQELEGKIRYTLDRKSNRYDKLDCRN